MQSRDAMSFFHYGLRSTERSSDSPYVSTVKSDIIQFRIIHIFISPE